MIVRTAVSIATKYMLNIYHIHKVTIHVADYFSYCTFDMFVFVILL